MSIIISQKGEKTQKIEKSEFEKESYMQEYIHENPEAIPVYEIEEDKKLFVVAREFSTESGPIDALAIDKDGDIYIVETKLQKNYTRREVVAQALDYGASLWRHGDYNEFVTKIDEEKVKEFFEVDDEQISIMLEAIKRNLQDGNIKFVILMDAIDDRLKDLIVYINQNSQFDIYAVQMEYYEFEKYKIVIPRMFGVEVKKDPTFTSASGRSKWNEQSFFQDVASKLNAEQSKTIRQLYDFSQEKAKITWGTGINQGSFSAKFNKLGNRPLFVIYSNGKMSISTEYPKQEASQEQIANLDKLGLAMKNVGIDITAVSSERTGFLIDKWSDKVDKIIGIISESIK